MSHLPDHENLELIARLLRMRKVLIDESLKDNSANKEKGASVSAVMKYLEDNYGIKIASNNQLYKLLKGSKDSGFLRSHNKTAWKKFVDDERALLLKSVHPQGSFVPTNYKFNINSAMQLVEFAEKGSECRFFNTYINMDEWHSPLVQMHLCVQKSIEQKHNLRAIRNCHCGNGKDSDLILACIDMPPKYRHLRVLFVPFTEKELQTTLQKGDHFFEGLRLSTLIHLTLSIQLAIVNVTQLASIMMGKVLPAKLLDDRIIEIKDFFLHSRNLEILGLPQTLGTLLQRGNLHEIEKVLKTTMEGLGEIPTKHTNVGMDFMQIIGSEDKESIWIAFNEVEEGLTYAAVTEDEATKIKAEFSNIIFETISEMRSPATLDILRLDPIYDFHQENGNGHLTSVFTKYDPKSKVGLS